MPRVVASQELRRRPSARLVLEMDVSERRPLVSFTMKQALVSSAVRGGGKQRRLSPSGSMCFVAHAPGRSWPFATFCYDAMTRRLWGKADSRRVGKFMSSRPKSRHQRLNRSTGSHSSKSDRLGSPSACRRTRRNGRRPPACGGA